MENNIKILIKNFERIKNMNWIESINNNSSGVGRTLENILNIPENSLEIPDFNGIEIKAHRINNDSYISLFCATPDGPHYHEIEFIKDNYGYPDNDLRQYKVLNVSVNAKSLNWFGAKYKSILKINYVEERIYLHIIDLFGNPVYKNTYWDFSTIKEKLYRKMQYLAYFPAISKKIGNKEYFKYNYISIYKIINFEKFIELIQNGIIILVFKASIFKKGKRKGQIKDHGTTFKINCNNINKLFTKIYSNIS